ncbi:MAG: metallophosphoesterase [Deltaproteobacteria bacterium]|nr:metallophosphoesterase [Deltaproteobacteria bacterium]
MRRIKVVVSDLHMGSGPMNVDGTVNGMEDFVGDQALIDLLEYYRTGEYADAEVELILNGDVFEGLLADLDDETPDLITVGKSVEKIRRALEGHRAVFDALGVFADDERRQVAFVVGNHDQDLYWEEVRELIRARTHPRVRFIDEVYAFDGVHLEHGHRHEHQNRIDQRKIFLTRGLPEPVLNLPWGSDMFLNVLMPLKRDRPYLNRVRPLRQAFVWVLVHDIMLLLRGWWNFIALLLRGRFRAQRERRITLWKTLRVMFSGWAYPTLEGDAGRILKADQGIHTVIFGHTHIPMWRQLAPGKTYVNSGSWMPTTNLHISAMGHDRKQTYVYIEYENNIPRARLKLWHGRRVIEENIVM